LHTAKRAIAAWVLYDFANSPFTTLVVTFVYATYFTQAIASDPIEGTVLWSRAVTVTALIVAICSPVLGALADRGGYRKRFVVAATLIAATATAALYGVLPGQVAAALVLFVIANVAFEFSVVFYNAFLPDLASSRNIGKISGWGWGLGYIGGLLALVLALLTLVQPDVPWFGLSAETGENVRATNLLVAAWYLVFGVPLFLFVHDPRRARSAHGRIVRDSLAQLRATFAEVRQHKEMVKFLIARLVYNDGLVTIFAFGGVYAAETFGFTLEEVLVFGIVINLAAGVGAIGMGYIDDLIGAKRTIIVSLLGLVAAVLIVSLAHNVAWFWFAGVIIGVFSGPNQSASRSLMGRYVPSGKQNEYFGFYAFSGKLTAFIGPFLLGVATDIAGSQRAGIAVVLLMFAAGLALLINVREPAQENSLE
jgi:UMF1 family MFS transporter